VIEAVSILARYVYPSVKRRLVEILKTRYNLTQKEIANLLSLSQSLVSRYLNKSRGAYLDISKAKETDREIREVVDMIMKNGSISAQELEYRLTIISLRALGRGDICQFHKQIDPSRDPEKCNICKILFRTFL